jgi:hypothetical protein
MNDGMLLWTDSVDGKGVYCLYNLSSGQTSIIDAPYKYPGYAKLMNNKIYSINFNDYTVWTSQSFGAFDINSSKYKELSSKYINLFRVGSNFVGVMDAHNQFVLYDAGNDLKKVPLELPVERIDGINFNYDGALILTTEEPSQTILTIISDL